NDFADLPELFAEVGVRLVYVEMLPSGKIDGCAMFVDGYPVIGLSGRGKRLDKVLLTLLHEIAHILLAHIDAERISLKIAMTRTAMNPLEKWTRTEKLWGGSFRAGFRKFQHVSTVHGLIRLATSWASRALSSSVSFST